MDRKYNAVIDYVHQLVQQNSTEEKIRIPSERELMEILDVSRSTVREAMLVLENQGFVDNEKSEGRFIAKDYRKNFFRPLNTFSNLFGESNFNQLLQVRAMLVKECLYLAYNTMTPEEKQQIQDFYDELMGLSPANEKFVWQSTSLWSRFWRLLFAMTRNEPLQNLVESFNAFIGYYNEDVDESDACQIPMIEYCLDANELHRRIFSGMLQDNIELSITTVKENYVRSHLERLQIRGILSAHKSE